jgi:glutamate racemase
MNKMSIGVFDSGVGGLTVLKEIIKALPGEGTVYLGDTARVPYGIRSPETVMHYSFENTNFLVKKGIKILIVACNTASSVSLEAIQQQVAIPVIGVVEPGARAAVRTTRNGKIGVIGTEATIRSGAYVRKIKELDGTLEVFGLPCPLFVSLAEEGFTDDEIALMVAHRYLEKLKGNGIDTLVLACTHYPLLKGVISKVMGESVTLIDSAVKTASEVKETLRTLNMQNESGEEPCRVYYVTDAPERFVMVGEQFLGQKIAHIEKIDVML